MGNQQIIAGVDSSTLSVKVVMRDAHTGQLLRQGRAAHPDGTEVLVSPAGDNLADVNVKQSAWALLGEMPTWDLGKVSHHDSQATPQVMDKYRTLRDNTATW
jgi:hypothetical protein